MEDLRELLRRELASEAADLSTIISERFQVRPDVSRPAEAYVFEIEKALPEDTKA